MKIQPIRQTNTNGNIFKDTGVKILCKNLENSYCNTTHDSSKYNIITFRIFSNVCFISAFLRSFERSIIWQ